MFKEEMVRLIIFLTKKHWNKHFKHENLLSIYENMNYFQIMWIYVTCQKFHKLH